MSWIILFNNIVVLAVHIITMKYLMIHFFTYYQMYSRPQG